MAYPRGGLRPLEWVTIVVILLVLAVMFWPVRSHRPMAPSTTCLLNLKQLSTGVMLYAADEYDRLPPAPAWMSVIDPYIKGPSIYHCPTAVKENDTSAYGYAFNLGLSMGNGVKIERPEETVMLYDSTSLHRNASDRVTSLPRPGRHALGDSPRRNHLAYADGHTRAVTDSP